MARVKRAVNAQKKRRTTLERASGYLAKLAGKLGLAPAAV